VTLTQKSLASVAAEQGSKSNKTQRKQINIILDRLPNSGGTRIFKHLAEMGRPCSTAELASACAVGNVSSAVSSVNQWLTGTGLTIINYAPNPPFQNRYGDKSPMHVWQLLGVE